MLLKEDIKFTGFRAYYSKEIFVKEKENYFSKKLKKNCATNWAEIDKTRLVALELLWHGQSKIKIDKKEYPHIKSEDWFFTHSGIYNMKNRSITIISRNIGFKKDNIIQVYSVEEETGILRSSVRGSK
jgi:hypothetical protein